MTSFSSLALQFSRYVHLKFKKQGMFLENFPLYEILKITDFGVFKIRF